MDEQKIPVAEATKPEQIQTSVTEAIKEEVLARSARAGIKPSEWLRVAVACALDGTRPFDAMLQEFRASQGLS